MTRQYLVANCSECRKPGKGIAQARQTNTTTHRSEPINLVRHGGGECIVSSLYQCRR
jgi:hypothetical protein